MDRDMDELFHRYLNGELDETELGQLREELKRDAGLRDTLVEYLKHEAMVIDLARAVHERSEQELGAGRVREVSRQAARRREPTGARQSGKAGSRRRVSWRTWLTVAACLAIVAGSLSYNEYRARTRAGVLVARIRETASGVTIIRRGEHIYAAIGMEIRSGDRIRTGEGQRASFAYENEPSEIRMRENTNVGIGDVEQGKRLDLPVGAIDAVFAPQPDEMPAVVITPQARLEVRGTTFSLAVADRRTRIEVGEGMVRVTRLADGETTDVTAGHYAVAAEGVELTALPLGEVPAPMTDLYDVEIIFEDNFSGSLDQWDVVEGTPEAGFETVTEDVDDYAKLGVTPEYWIYSIDRFVILNPGRRYRKNAEKYVGIRSKEPIRAERFMVEARRVLHPGSVRDSLLYATGIEVLETIHVRGDETADHVRGSQWQILRWEFLPAEDAPKPGMLECRFFAGKDGDEFVRSSFVRPAGTRILIAVIRGRPILNWVRARRILETGDRDE